jgi:hypothetical protein
MGYVFDDGPAPFFKRLNINSASMHFLDIGWFESPDEIKRRKELAVLTEEQEKQEKERTKIQTLKSHFPNVFEFINKEILPKEKSVTYDSISQHFKDDYLANGQKI